jgi:hypothetical protein
LRRADLAMHEIYLALFAHPPGWSRELLILRDRVVAPFGLRASGAADRKAIEIKPAYTVGEKIARFTLFGQNDAEIVTGGDDKHLDFRVSVRRWTEAGANRVALTTKVSPPFGRQDVARECRRGRAAVRRHATTAAMRFRALAPLAGW